MIIASAAAGAAVAAGAVVFNGRRKRAVLKNELKRRRETAVLLSRAQQDAERGTAMERAQGLKERLQNQLERRTRELDEDEVRLDERKTAIERRLVTIQERNDDLSERFAGIQEKRQEIEGIRAEIAGLEQMFTDAIEGTVGDTTENALTELAEELIGEAHVVAQKAARAFTQGIADRSELEAKRLIDNSCQRYGAALSANRLISTVTLPSKAAIRERVLADDRAVLRVIHELCDVEFIDQGEDVYFLQAPDPYTREIGRLAFERMIRSGNVNEEAARAATEKSCTNLDKVVRDAGRRAARILKIKGVHSDILHLVGKLLYRTSYTQNQWTHAIETAHLCGMMAEEMGLDIRTAHRAALMHDIGKVLWAETEACGSHAVSGAAFAAERGEDPDIVHPIAAHHNDEKPATPLAHLVAAADALSGARPGARRETLESYTQRVEEIEGICAQFNSRGVKRAYVIQGGREVRLEVSPRRVDDQAAVRLAGDVAKRIEEECIYPGQIKVTVLRETLANATARG